MTNERLLRQKNHAKLWAENMGMIPRKLPSGKAVWETEFVDSNGQTVTRKKTVLGKINPNAFLHIPTTGIAITKKIVKEFKRPKFKPKKYKPSDAREIPAHYMETVRRQHNERAIAHKAT